MSFAADLLEALPERYRLGRHLADGGMGSVWCAEDRTLGRTVAIKVLAARFATDEMAMRRFAREARAAAQLSTHPHVVTIYDVGEADGRPFIVMEYVPGGTVADALRVGAVSRAQAVRWIGEAAEALDFAHRHGIVHRDVKPQNLLLDRQRSMRIADFGIARLANDELLTGTQEVLGTAAYLAPEQALGKAGSAASDRYALAVVAFELLTGRRPFTAEHPAAQARAHIEDVPPAATSVDRSLPGAVDEVLRRGMAKRVDRRWPTATGFARALAAAVDGTTDAVTDEHTIPVPIAGPRRTPPRQPARPLAGSPLVERRRNTAAALVALLSVAAILLAILLSGGGARPGSGLALRQAGTGHRGAARHRTLSTSQTTAVQATPNPATTGSATTGSATTGQPQAPAVPASPDALEAQGHALLTGGQYTQAIPVLQKAVQTAPHDSLTYAYALFDLGRALRLSGQPQAAIPILEQRLQIPNQTAVVAAELRLAEKAAGVPPGHDHGHGKGPDGAGPPGQAKQGDGGD